MAGEQHDQYIAEEFNMRFIDLMGKIGEKAHVGTTRSGELGELFLSPGFMEIHIETIKLNWFWGIMIGRGMKPCA